jgi:hypothetical protein
MGVPPVVYAKTCRFSPPSPHSSFLSLSFLFAPRFSFCSAWSSVELICASWIASDLEIRIVSAPSTVTSRHIAASPSPSSAATGTLQFKICMSTSQIIHAHVIKSCQLISGAERSLGDSGASGRDTGGRSDPGELGKPSIGDYLHPFSRRVTTLVRPPPFVNSLIIAKQVLTSSNI